jgi:hypothetical protein
MASDFARIPSVIDFLEQDSPFVLAQSAGRTQTAVDVVYQRALQGNDVAIYETQTDIEIGLQRIALGRASEAVNPFVTQARSIDPSGAFDTSIAGNIEALIRIGRETGGLQATAEIIMKKPITRGGNTMVVDTPAERDAFIAAYRNNREGVKNAYQFTDAQCIILDAYILGGGAGRRAELETGNGAERSGNPVSVPAVYHVPPPSQQPALLTA